jgi:hypothetical protein
MADLGKVERSMDERGREVLKRLEAVVECDTCGKEVEMWSDTEEWVKEAGRWVHNQYGPAQGVCCQNLYVDSFEGCFRYKLEHTM